MSEWPTVDARIAAVLREVESEGNAFYAWTEYGVAEPEEIAPRIREKLGRVATSWSGAKVEAEAVEGMFADHAELVEHNRLRELLDRLRADGTLPARDVEVHRASGRVEVQQRLGERFMALAYRGVPVDLFLATADNWGCVLALRTGPHDWNVELVTQCRKVFRRVEGTRVLDVRDQVIPTPEEAVFFAALGQPWVEPRDRHPSRVRIERLAEVPA